jgi:replication-associated recombination protein RarA
MSKQPPHDKWQDLRTPHGLRGDEVISALQKEIRRGRSENAALLAHEMLLTSPEMGEKLWERLLIISVEDVGFGDPFAAVLVETLARMARTFPQGSVDSRIVAVHAIRCLCAAKKDRSSAEMAEWIDKAVDAGQAAAVIPDYAIDMHTAAGQRQGRSLRHFYEEAARVAPELEGRDTTYQARLLALLNSHPGTP